MSEGRVVIFWTEAKDNHAWQLSELHQGRLRQGWGVPGTQLVENGAALPYAEWARNFMAAGREYWGESPDPDYTRTRYSILSRMLPLKRGDLVVVPRMPRAESFTIARVTKGYEFDESQFHRVKDFGHVVHVDPDSLRTFDSRSPATAAAVASQFRNYRSAVNNINNRDYAGQIRALYDVAETDRSE